MNAIVPINVTALRVNENDNNTIVNKFRGRVAKFEGIPYLEDDNRASTGARVVAPLESNLALDTLGAGIHLHWELPDYFKNGVQQPDNPEVIFPQVPNRWLVTRFLSKWNEADECWYAPTSKSWVIESDFIAMDLIDDPQDPVNNDDQQATPETISRPAVPVPLPISTNDGEQPYRYMGRVQDLSDWDPTTENASDYLPNYQLEDQTNAYLTAIGFLGPGFASYYPDCCSVFGFWDRFTDDSDIYYAIKNDLPVQFKASYQITGWIDGGVNDPLNDIEQLVTDQYNDYIQQATDNGATIDQTPTDVFISMAQTKFGWQFNPALITYTLNGDQTLERINLPNKTICNGRMQEIVWNMLEPSENPYFLQNPAKNALPSDSDGAIWVDNVDKIGVGNTPIEALSAILKSEIANQFDGNDEHAESLLNSLQLNLLRDIEQQHNKFTELEESIHKNSFSKQQGGLMWVVSPKQDLSQSGNTSQEITLPLTLAEQLNVLNTAQKAYDMGRAQLEDLRKQLYMDWFRYVNLEAPMIDDSHVTLQDLSDFLSDSDNGAITLVEQAGVEVGILSFGVDQDSGAIISMNPPDGLATSKASIAYQAFVDFQQAMLAYPNWCFFATPLTPFWMPTDPVVTLEGEMIQPIVRNGTDTYLNVRLSEELLDQLIITYDNNPFTVSVANISDVPTIDNSIPYQADVQALLGESALLIPSLAPWVGTAMTTVGGTGNPAVSDLANFVQTLQLGQGGLSPIDTTVPESYDPNNNNLFFAIHLPNTGPLNNPLISLTAPLAMDITFTNNNPNGGWTPNAIAWDYQQQLPEFGDRCDPYLPIYMIWGADFDALQQDAQYNYASDLFSEVFELDKDDIDYKYKDANFTKNNPVPYSGSAIISSQSSHSLTKQIENYIRTYPVSEKVKETLQSIIDYYDARNFLSQTMSGFNVNQLLRSYIAQIEVEDLVVGDWDPVTSTVDTAAKSGNVNDNWYDTTSFNSQAPISTGMLAENNFGPLRAGFMDITDLEIVDVFGQRVQIHPLDQSTGNGLNNYPAMSVSPILGGGVLNQQIYLPPRLAVPTRIWFKWLSGTHNNEGPDFTSDFVETNSHPSTSPIFGWVVPNHLDNSLFFYQADGTAVGSFGIEHGDLVYRTTAGNTSNIGNDIATDIGPKGSPTINPHLANFLWFLYEKNGVQTAENAAFFEDMMTTIANSDQFINPANYAQNATLSVLVGRPLALTRAVIGLETAGNSLPLNQSDYAQDSPWPEDINANRTDYTDRMENSSSNVANIDFPIRLGDVANLDDGLIGYFIETALDTYDTFYSTVAPVGQQNGVESPVFNTLQTQLNATPETITVLMDPRANIHAIAGILPVEELGIPVGQYAKGMQSLQMTFFTMPVFNERQGLELPLPQENGYQWSWVRPDGLASTDLKAQAVDGNAIWDFTPQTAIEGWLKLTPNDTGDDS